MNRAKRIKTINHFMSHGQAIVDANHRSGLKDLPLACALVDQESGGRNTFGGDLGPAYRGRPPFYEEPVTEKKVKELIAHVKAGGTSNGVGPTQLTSLAYILEADAKKGGAANYSNNLMVGFKLLKSIVDQYGHGGIWHYNGAAAYQAQIEAKERTWRQRLA